MTGPRKRRPTSGENDTEKGSDESQSVFDLFATQVEEGMVVRVSRFREDGNRAFVVQLPISENIEHDIAVKCGSGKYLVALWGRSRGETRARQHTSAVVYIDPPPTTATAAEPTSPRDRIGDLLEGGVVNVFKAMADAQEVNARALERAMAPQQRTSPVLDKILDALLPVVAVKLADRFLDPPDPLKQVRELRELMNEGQPQRPRSALAEIREAMAIVREVESANAGAGATDDEPTGPVLTEGQPRWMQLAERLAIKLGERLLNGPPRQASGATAAVSPPAPGALLPPAGPEPESEETDDVGILPDELEQLRPMVAQLLEWARQGRSAAGVVQALTFMIDPEQYGAVVQALENPTVVNKLVTFVPKLRPHAAWLEEVRQGLLTAVQGAGNGGSAAPAAPAPVGPGAVAGGEGGGNGGNGGRARQARARTQE